MVSVIVPIYNVEQYLRRCIDSILKQTYSNLQIILVNDGSPDNSKEICEAYASKDERIIVINKENGGLSSARNAGLDVATGDYIAFIDSDDWVDEKFIEILRTNLIETNSDMAACMFCRTKEDVSTRSHFEKQVELIKEKKYLSVLTENSYAGYACNKMFKNQIIQDNKLRFDEQIFNGEDFPFALEYIKYVNKVAFIRQDLYFYFFRETGIMNTIRLNNRFITILYAREKALSFLEKNAPDCYDICKASYLSILSKVKYMSMLDLSKNKHIYFEVNEKLKIAKKGLFFLKKVNIKEKLKLFIMIYFPKISAKAYKKKVKVEI